MGTHICGQPSDKRRHLFLSHSCVGIPWRSNYISCRSIRRWWSCREFEDLYTCSRFWLLQFGESCQTQFHKVRSWWFLPLHQLTRRWNQSIVVRRTSWWKGSLECSAWWDGELALLPLLVFEFPGISSSWWPPAAKYSNPRGSWQWSLEERFQSCWGLQSPRLDRSSSWKFSFRRLSLSDINQTYDLFVRLEVVQSEVSVENLRLMRLPGKMVLEGDVERLQALLFSSLDYRWMSPLEDFIDSLDLEHWIVFVHTESII